MIDRSCSSFERAREWSLNDIAFLIRTRFIRHYQWNRRTLRAHTHTHTLTHYYTLCHPYEHLFVTCELRWNFSRVSSTKSVIKIMFAVNFFEIISVLSFSLRNAETVRAYNFNRGLFIDAFSLEQLTLIPRKYRALHLFIEAHCDWIDREERY